MADQLETYGAAGLRSIFMNDEKGKLIATDTLFENLYDFYTSYHDPAKSILLVSSKNQKTRKYYPQKEEIQRSPLR